MRSGLLTILSVSLLLPFAAGAQALGDFAGTPGTAFTISVTPQYPAPHSQATLSVVSGSLDLSNATMGVSVGGKSLYQGAAHPVSIPLGGAGSITEVEVTITAAGVPYLQSVTVQPQDVVLVAEPLSSAPVLYPGKPSVPAGGDVRIVAMANMRDAGGRSVAPSTLSYAWTVDDTRIADSSGIGKSAVVVASPLPYRSRTVSVVMTSPDGSLVGGASLPLSSTDPVIRVYENDPLLGILFDRALSSYAIAGSEATLFGAPYSFPMTRGTPLLQWFLNGNSAQTGNSITLRPTGSGKGNANLSFVVSSGNSLTSSVQIPLSFGTAPSNNFFGL